MRKTKDIAYVVFWVWPIFIITVAIIIGIIFRDELVFDPSRLINDFIDFMLGIISMFLGFWVANIYWKRRSETERTQRYTSRFVKYLSQLNLLIGNALKLLSQPVDDGEKAVQRDKKVLSICTKLGYINQNIIKFLDDSVLELGYDKNAAKASEHYRFNVEPLLIGISNVTKIRPRSREITDDLILTKKNIHQVILYLGGIYDESD